MRKKISRLNQSEDEVMRRNTLRYCALRGLQIVSYRFSLLLIVTTILILWSSSPFADNVSKPVISLATETECNCCVIYKIEIFKDGKVHWLGQSYVHEKGDRYKQIAVSKVDALLKKFDEAKFFELPNYGEERRKKHIILFDITPMVITLNKDSRKKSIQHYGELRDIEMAIYEATDLKNWLTPAPDPMESGCMENAQ